MDTDRYDVIIVGSGNAALCAALSAKDAHNRVLVLERADEDKSGGNSVFTGGGMRTVHHGLADVMKLVPSLTPSEIETTDFGEYTRETYLEDLGRLTEYYCDPELAETLVDNSNETVNWLSSQGVQFLPNYNSYSVKRGGASFSVASSSTRTAAGEVLWMRKRRPPVRRASNSAMAIAS